MIKLDYIYDTDGGRFLSIDPLWEKYLAWSPYHYCQNNPINATDGNGMWLEWGHNKIIDFAFGKTMSDENIQTLKQSSLDADKDQGLEGSFKHSMKAPWQTVEDAKVLYDNYLEQQIQRFANTEKLEDALYELGKGMHAISDAWCPSHNGFQTWNGMEGADPYPINYLYDTGVKLIKATIHGVQELQPTDSKATMVAKDLQIYYQRAIEARLKYNAVKSD